MSFLEWDVPGGGRLGSEWGNTYLSHFDFPFHLSKGWKVVGEYLVPLSGPTFIFTAPGVADDEAFTCADIDREKPCVIICDCIPKEIGLAPHLLKVCTKGGAMWAWFVNASTLGAAQSRERKIMIFANGRILEVRQFRPHLF